MKTQTASQVLPENATTATRRQAHSTKSARSGDLPLFVGAAEIGSASSRFVIAEDAPETPIKSAAPPRPAKVATVAADEPETFAELCASLGTMLGSVTSAGGCVQSVFTNGGKFFAATQAVAFPCDGEMRCTEEYVSLFGTAKLHQALAACDGAEIVRNHSFEEWPRSEVVIWFSEHFRECEIPADFLSNTTPTMPARKAELLGDLLGEAGPERVYVDGPLYHLATQTNTGDGFHGWTITPLTVEAASAWFAGNSLPVPTKVRWMLEAREPSPSPVRRILPTRPASDLRAFSPDVRGIGSVTIEADVLAEHVAATLHTNAAFLRALARAEMMKPEQPLGLANLSELGELLAICGEVHALLPEGFNWKIPQAFAALCGLGHLHELSAPGFLRAAAQALHWLTDSIAQTALQSLAPASALPLIEAFVVIEQVAFEQEGLPTAREHGAPTPIQRAEWQARFDAYAAQAA